MSKIKKRTKMRTSAWLAAAARETPLDWQAWPRGCRGCEALLLRLGITDAQERIYTSGGRDEHLGWWGLTCLSPDLLSLHLRLWLQGAAEGIDVLGDFSSCCCGEGLLQVESIEYDVELFTKIV